MNPSVDDRLASVVRALSDIILPALPASASLAREQCGLAMGQLQILRAQLPAAAAFADEELADTRALAEALLALDAGGGDEAAHRELGELLAAGAPASCLKVSIDGLIRHSAREAPASDHAALSKVVLEHETVRTAKERRWFAAMGFDQEFA